MANRRRRKFIAIEGDCPCEGVKCLRIALRAADDHPLISRGTSVSARDSTTTSTGRQGNRRGNNCELHHTDWGANCLGREGGV